jgi:arsenate reductase
MEKNVIYHNPKCSKSRKTLEILRENNAVVEVIEYLNSPPGAADLESLCTLLGVDPLQIIRTGDARFQELGFSVDDDRTRQEWIEILAGNSVLLQRPIVVIDGKAIIGRPPENVHEILTGGN